MRSTVLGIFINIDRDVMNCLSLFSNRSTVGLVEDSPAGSTGGGSSV